MTYCWSTSREFSEVQILLDPSEPTLFFSKNFDCLKTQIFATRLGLQETSTSHQQYRVWTHDIVKDNTTVLLLMSVILRVINYNGIIQDSLSDTFCRSFWLILSSVSGRYESDTFTPGGKGGIRLRNYGKTV